MLGWCLLQLSDSLAYEMSLGISAGARQSDANALQRRRRDRGHLLFSWAAAIPGAGLKILVSAVLGRAGRTGGRSRAGTDLLPARAFGKGGGTLNCPHASCDRPRAVRALATALEDGEYARQERARAASQRRESREWMQRVRVLGLER
jgi:hypothetical protein